MSIFSVGSSGLNAAQVGLLVTSHNISNASTAGYNRQQSVQSSNVPVLTGAGFIGQGTNVQTVRRIYDQFLTRQVLSAEAGAAEMASYLSQISQIDNLLADPSAGLSPAMTDFFKGVQEMAAHPSSIPARQSMLSAGQALVARFQALDQRMSEIRDGVNSQISAQVSSINTYATQLAEMNQKIILAESGSLTQAPNDLLDQRDQMLRELNQLVRVNTVTNANGSMSVFVGSGQPLVVGSSAYQFQAVRSNEDPERLVVAMKSVSGATVILPESQVTGGSLGGLLAFRGESLDSAQNALGRVALTLAQNFNDQHKLGIDLTGALGKDFFTMTQPVLRDSVLNTGSGSPAVSLDGATIDQLSASDYRLSFVGGNYQLTRLADNSVTLIISSPQVVDGMSIDISGWNPNNNDAVLIQPTRAGARNIAVAFSDERSIAAATPIRSGAALTNNGTGTISAGIVVDTTNASFGNIGATGELTPPLLVRFDTTGSFTVYDNSDPAAPVALEGPIAYTAGAEVFPTPGGFDPGYRITLGGAPAVGDSFTVEGNKNGVADNRNAQLLGALQTKNTMRGTATSGPTASYQSAYSQIVSQVGTKTAEVQSIGEAQQSLADYANQAVQQISGVNLDEEAANLLRYQQAYQASAKILEIAGKVFDSIITLG